MMELTVIKRDLEGEVLEVRFIEMTKEQIDKIWLDDEQAGILAGFEPSEEYEIVADFYSFCEEY